MAQNGQEFLRAWHRGNADCIFTQAFRNLFQIWSFCPRPYFVDKIFHQFHLQLTCHRIIQKLRPTRFGELLSHRHFITVRWVRCKRQDGFQVPFATFLAEGQGWWQIHLNWKAGSRPHDTVLLFLWHHHHPGRNFKHSKLDGQRTVMNQPKRHYQLGFVYVYYVNSWGNNPAIMI